MKKRVFLAWERQVLDLIREGDKVVGLRLQGQDFLADLESGDVVVPKKFLTGFDLSEIPEALVIKPVEAIQGNVIHVENDISIGYFVEGQSLVRAEEMGRRKLWDGEVGFGKFMEAMRQAVRERHETYGDVEETDFQDDGDYIFLWYQVIISEDMAIEEALKHIAQVIAKLEERREQILVRRLDPLVELLDRGSFDTDLAHVLETAEAKGSSLALVFVDIDHFKRINDSRGHLAGDAVLRGVARILRQQTAGKGGAYRYGGEELAALLTGLAAKEGAEFADRIRRTIQESAFEGNVKVTVSCGVASYPSDAMTANELIAAADAALYSAKQAGRNVVRVASL